MKGKCFNCPYNQGKLGNGCGNDYCIQESVMFDVSINELRKETKKEYFILDADNEEPNCQNCDYCTGGIFCEECGPEFAWKNYQRTTK